MLAIGIIALRPLARRSGAMSQAAATVGDMITTPALGATVEACPVCDSTDVRATEPHWFVLEFERADEVRGVDLVEFSCRECGSAWA